ncbi:myb domain protein 70 [Actinidia rufa]|uniref:Myb domain protein 70 n=1 Tax=Actinidia rufa TaxID=165716 RepID=A0A7J0EJE5_9ERIC|nr:myb domain protein 70 [Actinidia rufa]
MACSKKDMDRIKGPWSPEEDDMLQKLVQKHGPRNWSVISKSIPVRIARPDLTSAIRAFPVLSSSHVYRPVARTGGIETASLVNDPPTSLTLSPPGVDSNDSLSRVNESTQSSAPIQLLPVLPPPMPATSVVPVNHLSQKVEIVSPPPPASSMTIPVPVAPTAFVQRPEKAFVPISAELLAVMQEMIRTEVWNYMSGIDQQDGISLCMKQATVDEFRNAIVKRIGISKIE